MVDMSGEPIRVLHVDDEPDFLEVAAAHLERADDRFTVVTATGADAGLERLADSEVDCVVSDYQMPGTDGLEFLDAVREECPDLPFILFTGKGSEGIASEAISAGVTDYVRKGTGTDQYAIMANRIANAVKTTRGKHRQRRHLEAIETAREGISLLDEDGRFRYVNRAYADIYGYEPDELVGEHWGVLYPDDEQDRVHDEIMQKLDANGRWRGETVGLRRDGETLVEDHSLALTDDGGLVCVVRDVTERATGSEDPSFFERVIEGFGVGAVVYGNDGRIEYANERFASMLGADRNPLIGRRIWNVRTDLDPGRFDDYWGSFREEETRTAEVELAGADGAVRLAEITTARCRIDGSIHHVAVCTELAERSDARRREEHREYRNDLYDLLADAELPFEEKQRRLLALGCDYLGLSEGELVRTDPEAGRHESVRVANDRSREGTVTDLAESYCRHVVEDGERLAVPHVGASALADDPAYEASTRECYVGAPVLVDGDIYGTVRFYDPEPNDPFTESELTFVELVARGIGSELERRRQETELQQYRTMVNTAGDMVYRLDDEGRFEFVNDATEEFTGYDREELIGERVELIMDDEDLAAGRDLIRNLLREEGTGRRSDSFEWTLHRADGDTVPCETHVSLLYANGEWLGTVGVARDMTDRTERERELEMYEAAVEAAQDGITALNADGTYRMVNSVFTEVVGIPRADLLGEDPTVLVERGVIDESAVERGVEKAIECLDEGAEQVTFETRVESPTFGEEIVEHNLALITTDSDASDHLETTGDTPVPAPAGVDVGAIDGAVITHRKITERKKREEALRERERELKRQNERLEDFASVVSHDLRNPLNVARGGLELLRDRYDGEEVDRIERAHDRMERIIDGLLELARQGESVQDLEVVEGARVVEDAWGTVETEGAELRVDWDASVMADPGRLRQLLENLFRNAVEHAGDDVTVRIGGLEDGSGFYVADDGPGVSDDERERVFDPGYSTNAGGTGLGLNIVSEIAEAHGWQVDVTGGERGGARFEITDVEVVE